MSSHHQTAATPAKSDRRVEHHRERQATRAALHIPDLEEVLDAPSVHNTTAAPDADRSGADRHRRSHAKQPWWKRRSKGRRDRDATVYRISDK